MPKPFRDLFCGMVTKKLKYKMLDRVTVDKVSNTTEKYVGRRNATYEGKLNDNEWGKQMKEAT